MMKSSSAVLSSKWVVQQRSGAAYTGGAIALVGASHGHAACLCFERVAILNLSTGVVDRFIPADASVSAPLLSRLFGWKDSLTPFSAPSPSQAERTEPIVTFDVSPDGNKLVTFSRNLMVRLWDPATGACVRSWKGHRLPVATAAFEQSGTLIASGGTDKVVMVWDVDGGYATHSLRGHSGLITAVAFQHAAATVTRLVSGAEDGGVRVWDLVTQACVASFTEHYSAVTSLIFSPDAGASLLVSAGRDGVCQVWDTREIDLASGGSGAGGAAVSSAALSTACLKATIPSMEAIESAVMLPAEATATGSAPGARELEFVTVGEKGGLRRWKVVVVGAARAERKYTTGCTAVQTAAGLRRDTPALMNATSGIPDRGAAAINAASGVVATGASAGASNASSGTVATARQFERVLLRRVEAAPQPAAAAGSLKRKRAVEEPAVAGYELLAVTRDQVLTCVR
jgi:hypothetical protein